MVERERKILIATTLYIFTMICIALSVNILKVGQGKVWSVGINVNLGLRSLETHIFKIII